MTILQIGAGSIGWNVAGFHGFNEVMFHNGVDLTGEQAPTLIRCGSQATHGKLLALLADRGITHLGGRPATNVTNPNPEPEVQRHAHGHKPVGGRARSALRPAARRRRPPN